MQYIELLLKAFELKATHVKVTFVPAITDFTNEQLKHFSEKLIRELSIQKVSIFNIKEEFIDLVHVSNSKDVTGFEFITL